MWHASFTAAVNQASLMKFGRYSADNYEWCCRDKCEYVLSGLDWMRTIESARVSPGTAGIMPIRASCSPAGWLRCPGNQHSRLPLALALPWGLNLPLQIALSHLAAGWAAGLTELLLPLLLVLPCAAADAPVWLLSTGWLPEESHRGLPAPGPITHNICYCPDCLRAPTPVTLKACQRYEAGSDGVGFAEEHRLCFSLSSAWILPFAINSEITMQKKYP